MEQRAVSGSRSPEPAWAGRQGGGKCGPGAVNEEGPSRPQKDPRKKPGVQGRDHKSLSQVGTEEQGALCACSQTEGHEGPCVPPFPACV